MKKLISMIGALIAGGLGVAVMGFTQAAHAVVQMN